MIFKSLGIHIRFISFSQMSLGNTYSFEVVFPFSAINTTWLLGQFERFNLASFGIDSLFLSMENTEYGHHLSGSLNY